MFRLTRLIGLVLLASAPLSVRADEKARALIQRALQVQEGESWYPKRKSTVLIVTGKPNAKAQQGLTLEGMLYQDPTRNKVELTVHFLGQKIQVVQVTDGNKSWQMMNGTVSPLSEAEQKHQSLSFKVDNITRLHPLLTDQRYKLRVAEPSKIEDREVDRVEVTADELPAISLDFDRKTGTLFQVSWTSEGKKSAFRFLDYETVTASLEDQQLLREAGIGLDGASLLKYLHKQRTTKLDPKLIAKHIKALESETFEEREQAQRALLALGAQAIPALEKAAESDDPEVVRRSSEILKVLAKGKAADLVASAVRGLGYLQPEGTAQALLDAIPTASASAAKEMQAVLFAVAQRSGGKNQALLAALKDTDPQRRLAAERALGKDGGAYAKKPGRRLYLCNLKFPRTQRMIRSTEDDTTLTVKRVEFYNALDDSLFTKPKGQGRKP